MPATAPEGVLSFDKSESAAASNDRAPTAADVEIVVEPSCANALARLEIMRSIPWRTASRAAASLLCDKRHRATYTCKGGATWSMHATRVRSNVTKPHG